MLLNGAALIAVVLTAVGYILGIYEAIWAIPIAFIVCYLGILLIWIATCFIVTRFVNFDKECDKHSPMYRFYADCIIDTVRQFFRIKLHVQGKEILPQEKFLLVCNHRSNLDPLLTMGVLSKYHLGFVAKKELFKIPIISRLMHKAFCLCLDRGDVKESAKVILRAGQIIKDDLASVGIYPEGTRSQDEEMLPFKHGAFKIAKKAECPIVVATIRNTELATKNFPLKRTHVYLDFIEIIDKAVVAESSTVQLSNISREIMEKHFEELKK